MSDPRRIRVVAVRGMPSTSNTTSDTFYVSLTAAPWQQAMSDEERRAILLPRVRQVLAQEGRT